MKIEKEKYPFFVNLKIKKTLQSHQNNVFNLMCSVHTCTFPIGLGLKLIFSWSPRRKISLSWWCYYNILHFRERIIKLNLNIPQTSIREIQLVDTHRNAKCGKNHPPIFAFLKCEEYIFRCTIERTINKIVGCDKTKLSVFTWRMTFKYKLP